MKEVKEEMVDDDTGLATEDNPYFCPGILTVLFDMYLAIFPLWSGLLLGDLMDECHEQYMETTKKQPKTRDANCHIERWFGIVKHSIMHKEKKVKPGTFIRKMHKSLQASLKKLGRRRKNISHPPNPNSFLFHIKYLLPEKRIKKDVEVIQMLLKKEEHTELLVAIVQSPSQDLEFLLHHKEFNALRSHEWLFGETIECYFRAVVNKEDANLYQLSHDTTDNQERILRGILDRVQMPDEPLPTFVAHMLGEFRKLKTPPPQLEQIDLIQKHVLEKYRVALYGTPIPSVMDLLLRAHELHAVLGPSVGRPPQTQASNREHLRQLQLNDPVTGELLQMLEGKDESNAEELSQYVIQDGLLYFVDDKVSMSPQASSQRLHYPSLPSSSTVTPTDSSDILSAISHNDLQSPERGSTPFLETLQYQVDAWSGRSKPRFRLRLPIRAQNSLWGSILDNCFLKHLDRHSHNIRFPSETTTHTTRLLSFSTFLNPEPYNTKSRVIVGPLHSLHHPATALHRETAPGQDHKACSMVSSFPQPPGHHGDLP
ncbi:hypothetical protein DPX16_23724 [Anabarilius grahami]|uniref:Uncharacterized protein n=1 Tax=Anabarilius grahami TaxID=495550 RepID=A0A3N0XMY7_ANAGA|nr:hypothetical protein DPX16_23724 [Anabarilius grahami]